MSFIKVLSVSAVLLLGSTVAWADATPEECKEATANFNAVSTSLSAMMKTAYGYAIFPTIGKGGFGIGGAGGTGCVYQGDAQTGTSKMGQITIGFQVGGQAYSQIILFENKKSYDAFTSGGFEFGAQATAVALTASVQAEAGTKGASSSVGASDDNSRGKAGSFVNGMAVYTVAKGGLMYEASIGGQKFEFEAL